LTNSKNANKIDKQEIKALEWRFNTQRDDLRMAL